MRRLFLSLALLLACTAGAATQFRYVVESTGLAIPLGYRYQEPVIGVPGR